ncbi:DUF418 domain-containing protein [Oceanobacillus sp. J11TS1]|uniref:DUF418 domain-containing protein n=1 Tax=Oceanobacillus sp. J11TS1 TaxID=2807191 RepID=UPI001B124F4C|nr:DUF418 domain-containing protein [Oceanobacillus sp. J11TS1]GIO21465.1 hypothetical protein J11TS1_00460 [Oceanobacillus sp. J11TS1]
MNQRVKMIDGLRGFCLLGILIANMLIFQYGIFGKDNIETFALSMEDQIAYIWTKIFVEGSFYPIFMFLFGYSLMKMKESIARKGKKAGRHLIRRFLLLMLFGFLHSMFVWEGDVLLAYGLTGFFLLFFINRKKKTVLIWAILLFIGGTLFGFGEMDQTVEEAETMESYIQKETTIYSTGDYMAIFDFRNNEPIPFDLPKSFSIIVLLLTPIVTAPMFLFGMFAAKSNWFTTPTLMKKVYLRTSFLFVSIGLLLKSSPYIIDTPAWTEAAYMAGGTILAIGYIFTFALFYTKETGKLLSYFEQYGRLSMTNYLCQSIICTSIFYGYGLGGFANIGVFNGILLAIFIFSMQVLLSNLYLKYFKMGPFEKALRVGTYLSWSGKSKQTKPMKTAS